MLEEVRIIIISFTTIVAFKSHTFLSFFLATTLALMRPWIVAFLAIKINVHPFDLVPSSLLYLEFRTKPFSYTLCLYQP